MSGVKIVVVVEEGKGDICWLDFFYVFSIFVE
jgi:hypothetical protein